MKMCVTELLREISFNSFASPFLGYASTDGVSACSPLTAVEVAEAFHCSVFNVNETKPHKINVCLIYAFQSSHYVGFFV